MTTTLSFSHSLFTTPFDHNTDFTDLADNCAQFVDALVECDDPTEKWRYAGDFLAGSPGRQGGGD